MTRLRALFLFVLFLGSLAGQEKAADSPAEKGYRALQTEFDESLNRFSKALDAAKTADERKKAVAEHQPRPDLCAPKFMALARKYPKSERALDCLAWVVMHPVAPDLPQAGLRGQALALLSTDYVGDPRLGRLCTQLVQSVDAPTEKFLRAVLGKGATKGVKARACASLAHNLKYRARLIHLFKEDESVRKEFARIWGKATLAALQKADPETLLAESQKGFETVRDTYGDLPHPLHGTMAQFAKWHLLSIRKPITLDKPSPNTAGLDVAGKRMTLREYNGRVILIDFWASYFPSCQQMLDYERKLVARMGGKPFVLIGVNGDGDKVALRKKMKAEKITWRSWYDNGGTGGPIATRWEVDTWPTLVLIDHQGIVRSIYEGWPETKSLEAEIDKLVKAAEKAK